MIKIINFKSYWSLLLKSVCIFLTEQYKQNTSKTIFAVSLLFLNTGCKKLVEINQPVNSVTTQKAFSNETDATSAINGIYYDMVNVTNATLNSGGMTIYTGLSSDELNLFITSINDRYQFQTNSLSPTNNYLYLSYWQVPYSFIYRANAVIEGLQTSTGVRDSVKKELIGEAKFIRAFENFYLINLFGDIPLVTTVNWRNTNLLPRTSVSDVYSSIVADLKDAQLNLSSNFSVGKGERIIPNSYAATAFLARVYLYSGEWGKAEDEATKIINNNTFFSLSNKLSLVYSSTSKEAIWQLKQDDQNFFYGGTYEGNILIPRKNSSPFAFLTDSLLKSFESNDQRRYAWIDSVKYPVASGRVYYYPKKYQTGPEQQNGTYTEYYTVFRLAEQYLIRSEARARQSKLSDATADLNIIRNRAGLSSLSVPSTQTEMMTALEQENRVEFFSEWGHRWLDLKRWNKANNILGAFKGSAWQITDQLYPIPDAELKIDPNLTQNTGY